MKCYLCKNKVLKIITIGTDYEYETILSATYYYQCEKCSHIFQEPMPSLSEISLMYDSNYYTINPKSPLYLKGFIHSYKIKSDVDKIIKAANIHKESSVMDIGCGDCSRLFRLREVFGDKIVLAGVDLNFTEKAKKKAISTNINLIELNIESDTSKVFDNTFDLIVMSQLIEHLREPRKTLNRLKSMLSKNGNILIETPSSSGLDYFFFKKTHWGGYHIPRHLHIFSKNSLSFLATQQNMKIKQHRYLPSPGFWIISLRNKLGLNSISKSKSIFEFFNFSNIIVIGVFVLIDFLMILLRLGTSNQQILITKRNN